MPVFPIWYTLELCVYKSVDDLRAAIKARGRQISSWAEELLDSKDFELTYQKTNIELVIVTNAALGRPQGCQFEETVRLAVEQGLDLCPADTAPQLFVDVRLTVATKPMADARGSPSVFRLESGWLCRCYADGPVSFRGGDYNFVFQRRKAA